MDDLLYAQLADRLASHQRGTFATVVHTSGSTPQRPGAKAIFTPEGGVLGTIGGGCLEHEARLRGLELLHATRQVDPGVVRCELLTIQLNHDFDQDSGLICGGTAEVLLEVPDADDLDWLCLLAEARAADRAAARAVVVAGPGVGSQAVVADGQTPQGSPDLTALVAEALRERRGGVVEHAGQRVYVDLLLPRPRLWIAGAGHVGRAVARHARLVDYEVTLLDDRPDLCSPQSAPEAEHHVVGAIEPLLAAGSYGPEDYIVIVTRGHRHDADALRAVVGAGARYVGLIGSRRKLALIQEGLLEEGVATADELAGIYAPIGLDLGAITVDEIAVSIVAELIAVRRGRLSTPAERGWRPAGERRAKFCAG